MEIPDIIIFTGAGLSAESGIRTFRDSGGLWEEHKIEDVCNENTWKNNFEIVHQFYNQRRLQLADVEPNEAHKTIKRLQDKYGASDKLKIITQNVDNLLEQAGCRDVLHVHGFLTEMECTACGNKWDIGTNEWDIEKDRCPKCDSRKGVKPHIVFFYGPAPMYRPMYKAFDLLVKPESIVIVVGTDGSVVPISTILQGTKCKKVLCNLHPSIHINTEMFDLVFEEPAGTALPKIEKWLDEQIGE